MSILKRIGTQQIKLDFNIKVHYVSIRLAKSVPIKVVWKRRNKISETSVIQQTEPRTDFSQTLTMSNTIYQKSSGYIAKEAELKIFGDFSGTWKDLGRATINLSEFIETPAVERVLALQKTSEKDGMICVSVSFVNPQAKSKEINSPNELVEQLNGAKIKLNSLKNDLDQVNSLKEVLQIQCAGLEHDLQVVQSTEVGKSTQKLQEENKVLNKRLEVLKIELELQKRTNSSLEGQILQQKMNIAQDEHEKILNLVSEEHKDGDIDNQVDKLGERLNDIMRRYTTMPK